MASSVVEITSDHTPPVILGEQLVLTCSVPGLELHELEWSVVENEYADKVHVRTNLTRGVSSLTIHTLSSSDAGVYKCKVAYHDQSNRSLTSASDKITITAKSKLTFVWLSVLV